MTIPSDDDTYIYIHGIEVLEHEDEQLMGSESENYYIPKYSYKWNFDERHFEVVFLEYEQDERHRVVESIIMQLE